MTSGIPRRLAQLEKARLPGKPAEVWALFAMHEGETEEQALARYMAEHPEEPKPAHWIALVGVAPKHGENA